MKRFEKYFKRIKPVDPCFHYNRININKVISRVPAQALLLDIGSGGRRINRNIISLDIDKDADVDIIADASYLPFKEGLFDLIISTAVLEHVINLHSAISEIERCCRERGLIYIEVPFLQTYHAHPHDYRRFTLPGLELVFKHFIKIESGVCVGPFSTLAWYSRKIVRFIIGENIFGYAAEFIVGWLTFWIKYLDFIIPRARNIHQAASGVYFWGRKR